MALFHYHDTAMVRNRSGARIARLGGMGRNKFWGAREVYSSVDQTKKVKIKKKVFSTNISANSGCRLKILTIFHEFLSEDQKKKVLGSKVL